MRNKLVRTSLLTTVSMALLLITASHVASQQLNMISDLSIEADRYDYVGACPRDIRLSGKFRVNEGGLGAVSVQFVHSDGTPGEPRPLTANDKGVYTVDANLRQTYTWNDVVFLRVTVARPSGPKQFDSSRITIKGDCRQAQIVPATVSPFVPEAGGRFRVTLTGFVVNRQTMEGPFSVDGAGDEVFALVDFAELGWSNNILGPLENRMSRRYGDTAGIGSHTIPETIQAGRASATGGFRSGDPYPERGNQAHGLPSANAPPRAGVIPMVLWEGYLRRGGVAPNATVIIPTIWENDNSPDILHIWNRQVDTYLRRFASSSRRLVTSVERRPLVLRSDIVLNTIPRVGNFDRPVGIEGDTFNPLAASPLPATFNPAVMLLTYDTAEEAASSTSNSTNRGRGVIEITYSDGPNYGDGSYTIFLLVERLP